MLCKGDTLYLNWLKMALLNWCSMPGSVNKLDTATVAVLAVRAGCKI